MPRVTPHDQRQLNRLDRLRQRRRKLRDNLDFYFQEGSPAWRWPLIVQEAKRFAEALARAVVLPDDADDAEATGGG